MSTLFTSGKFQATNADGPVAGALVYTYSASTLTPLSTYTDQGGGTFNENPVECDANGQAAIWLASGIAYRVILKTPAGVTIWDEDNIIGPQAAGGAASFSTLAASGNVTLGDASTDTLDVGNGGIIKDASGNVGLGVSPTYQLHVSGAGQTTANLTDAGNKGGTIYLLDSASAGVGNGGVVAFGGFAKTTPFAAIKGSLQDAAGTTTGDLVISTRATTAASALTERVRIVGTSGLVSVTGGIIIGNTAVSDGTVLDWYEEGTFTPAITFGGAATGATYSSNRMGRFTRIGNRVFGNLRLILTAKGSSTGTAKITGLPYAADGNPGSAEHVCAVDYNGLTGLTGAPFGIILDTQTSILLVQTGAAASASLTDTSFTNAADVYVSFQYKV